MMQRAMMLFDQASTQATHRVVTPIPDAAPTALNCPTAPPAVANAVPSGLFGHAPSPLESSFDRHRPRDFYASGHKAGARKTFQKYAARLVVLTVGGVWHRHTHIYI